MDDAQFRQLLEHLGLSWEGYRKVRRGVKKRVARHMQAEGCRDMPAYLERLARSEEASEQCALAMSVSISRFFRDRRLWEVLERLILPELRQICGSRLRVWSAGCACGEEVYSLKLLWEQLLPAPVDSPALDITATDLNPRYLKKAQEALYPLSSLKEVPENLSAAGFRKKPGGKRFEVKPALRGGITWRVHDFFSAPPGSGFHLVFVRNNLLTYYRAVRIAVALEEIIASLGTGGYLVIGSHEKLPFPPAALQPCPSLAYAFRKTA